MGNSTLSVLLMECGLSTSCSTSLVPSPQLHSNGIQCFASWLSMCKVEMALKTSVVVISIVAMNVKNSTFHMDNQFAKHCRDPFSWAFWVRGWPLQIRLSADYHI